MLNEDKYFNIEKVLEETLKTEPGFSLPNNFAEVVAKKAGRKFIWEQYLKEFLIYLAAFFGIVAITVAMAYIWYGENLNQWGNFLLSNLDLVVGINILLVFILFADRVLLRYFFYKSSISTQ